MKHTLNDNWKKKNADQTNIHVSNGINEGN